MKNKEAARQYVTEFIELRKGVERVAAETGIHRATIRQIYSGRNGVSQKTVDRFAEVYGDAFDRLRAEGYSVPPQQPVSDMDSIDWKARYMELEGRYGKILTELETLRTSYNDLIATLTTKMKLSFPESGSHPTAFSLFNRLGFDYPGCEDMQPEGRVLPMPVTRVREDNVIAVRWGVATEQAAQQA